MNAKKAHISIFMLLVYVFSFSLNTLTSPLQNTVGIKKECPNKNQRISATNSTLNALGFRLHQPIKPENGGEKNTPHISICTATMSFVLAHAPESVFMHTNVRAHLPLTHADYISPLLERLPQPPQSV